MHPVTADMLISDVLASHPEAAAVFERHGLSCGACLASSMETVSAVASIHDVSVSALLSEINELAPDSGTGFGREL